MEKSQTVSTNIYIVYRLAIIIRNDSNKKWALNLKNVNLRQNCLSILTPVGMQATNIINCCILHFYI